MLETAIRASTVTFVEGVSLGYNIASYLTGEEGPTEDGLALKVNKLFFLTFGVFFGYPLNGF